MLKGSNKGKDKYLPYIYIAPAVILMCFLTLLPNLYSFYLSFTNYSLFHFQKFDFVGLKNYLHIVRGAEFQIFIKVFIWTLIWSFVSVFGMVTVGMLLAIPLNNNHFKGKNIYRTLLIVPWAIPAFITVLMWQGILNSDMGAVNLILTQLFHIKKVPWLSDPFYAKLSVLIVNIWLGFPFMMSICLGSLQSIPSSLYEAASVDGATPRQQLWKITIPLLRNAMLPVLISSFAFNFNQFGSIYLLTGGGPAVLGSPNAGATDILVTYSYKLAFNLFKFGLASAYAVFIFVIIATLSSVNFKLTKAFD